MLQLCVHPNSNIVLEMLHNGEVIIEFDDAMHKLSTEAALFTILGVFAYLCAAFGVIKIIRKEIC